MNMYSLLRHRRLWIAGFLLSLLAVGLFFAAPHLRAWYHFRAARTELERYHNPQAERHLRICLSIWPNDADVQLLAARAARRARRYRDAEGFLEAYQKKRGADAAGAQEQLLLKAECHIDEAADLCWRYVEQGRADAPLLLEALTRGYLRRYQLGEARKSLERWRQLQPDNAEALCLEGFYLLTYDREHSGAAAAENYSLALQLDADHEEARLGLAIALMVQQKFSEAVPHLEFLRHRQPEDSKIQLALAECHDGLGEVDEAERLTDAVLAREPHSAPALALRGRLAMEKKQFAEAERWLRQAVELDPVDRRSRNSLIHCLNNLGKDKEAWRMQQQFEKVKEDWARFNEIVTRDMGQRPRDPALHCEAGEILLRCGQEAEGLRWLQSALAIDPNYAPARRALTEHQRKHSPKND